MRRSALPVPQTSDTLFHALLRRQFDCDVSQLPCAHRVILFAAEFRTHEVICSVARERHCTIDCDFCSTILQLDQLQGFRRRRPGPMPSGTTATASRGARCWSASCCTWTRAGRGTGPRRRCSWTTGLISASPCARAHTAPSSWTRCAPHRISRLRRCDVGFVNSP